jgi:hypothetical protein
MLAKLNFNTKKFLRVSSKKKYEFFFASLKKEVRSEVGSGSVRQR